MKKIIIIALSIALISGILIYFLNSRDCCKDGKCTKAGAACGELDKIVLDGTYQGKNLFVQNPFLGKEEGFCIREIKVNDKAITEFTSSAFEIDLKGIGFNKGDKVIVEILHKKGCSPKILNGTDINGNTGSLKKSDNPLMSVVTCPKCQHSSEEIMPEDVCQLSYTCKSCKTELHPKDGDCCIFCSYGSRKCPSMQ